MTILAAVAAGATAVDTSAPARADNVYEALAAWTGTGYVYVSAGESMTLHSAQVGAIYRITRPDGSVAPISGVDSCTVTADTPCVFSEVAPVEGVWMIQRTGGTVATSAVEEIGPRKPSGDLITGRLWLEKVTVDAGNPFGSASSRFFVLSNYGVQYSISLPRYQPWGAVISADNMGITYAGTCKSTYFSVPFPGSYEIKDGIDPSAYSQADLSCPNYVPYRIFPEKPAVDMPASATEWADGRITNRWVYTDYQTPAVTSQFARSSGDADAGAFSGMVSGQPGTLTVLVDADGDGDYDGPEDVRLPAVAEGLGSYSIEWDGRNALGHAVDPSLELRYEVRYAGESEIHFVSSDFEGRTDGISMTRLNGPRAPDSRINWDDETALSKRSSDDTIPEPLKGVEVDSGTPQHSWSGGIPTNLAYGWGDQRRIEDWATVGRAVVSRGVIPPVIVPTPTPTPTPTRTASPTATSTATPTETPTRTAAPTQTARPAQAMSPTPTRTPTPTATSSQTASPTPTQAKAVAPTGTPSATETARVSVSTGVSGPGGPNWGLVGAGSTVLLVASAGAVLLYRWDARGGQGALGISALNLSRRSRRSEMTRQ